VTTQTTLTFLVAVQKDGGTRMHCGLGLRFVFAADFEHQKELQTIVLVWRRTLDHKRTELLVDHQL
jgi:hypothetical protein